jgi:signal peptidase I
VNRRTLGCLFELLETLLVTLLIFLLVQLFVAQPYRVQQASMEDTLMPDQFVLVDKLTPHFDAYHRADIIVFTPPAGWVQDPSGAPFVKRVIGVGGDTVDIHGGHVFVNGTQLTEPYVFENQATDMPDNAGKTWKLSADQVFVLGDHRQDSRDSRDFGPIEKSSIIGRAWLRYWPLNDFGLVSHTKPGPATSNSPAPSGSPAHSGSPAAGASAPASKAP